MHTSKPRIEGHTTVVAYVDTEPAGHLGEAIELAARTARCVERTVGGFPEVRVGLDLTRDLRAAGAGGEDIVIPVSDGPGMATTRRSLGQWTWLLAHELTHHALRPLEIRDRLLEEALADAVGEACQRAGSGWIAPDQATSPPLVMLERFGPRLWRRWEPIDPRRLPAAFRHDPERAYTRLQRDIDRYQAGLALIRRWITAARDRGFARPLEALVAALRKLGPPVTRRAADEICRKQTGRSLEELASLTGDDRRRAVERAWKEMDSPDPLGRIWALNVLGTWREPVDGKDLRIEVALQGDAVRSLPPTMAAELLRAAARAAARGDATDVLVRVRDAVPALTGKPSIVLPAEFWLAWARIDREEAVCGLLGVLSREPDLDAADAAARALRSLTGWDGGWRPRSRRQRRLAAQQRWLRRFGSGCDAVLLNPAPLRPGVVGAGQITPRRR